VIRVLDRTIGAKREHIWLVLLCMDLRIEGREIEEGKKERVEATSLICIEVTKEKGRSPAKVAYGAGEPRKALAEPTSAEVSRLTFGPLSDIRIFHQQWHNQFAHLLNRGSSLE
jgi:hypothetical protein